MTISPQKEHALRGTGLRITSVDPVTTQMTPHNQAYLSTKRVRLGYRVWGNAGVDVEVWAG